VLVGILVGTGNIRYHNITLQTMRITWSVKLKMWKTCHRKTFRRWTILL